MPLPLVLVAIGVQPAGSVAVSDVLEMDWKSTITSPVWTVFGTVTVPVLVPDLVKLAAPSNAMFWCGTDGFALAVAVAVAPTLSVTVTFTVSRPGLAYVCGTTASGPDWLWPSPKSNAYVEIVPSGSPDPLASTVQVSELGGQVTVSA